MVVTMLPTPAPAILSVRAPAAPVMLTVERGHAERGVHRERLWLPLSVPPPLRDRDRERYASHQRERIRRVTQLDDHREVRSDVGVRRRLLRDADLRRRRRRECHRVAGDPGSPSRSP